MGIARGRLQEERKTWRKDHPHGFVAKPQSLPDGTQNIMKWDCIIPGKQGTVWEGANIPISGMFDPLAPSNIPLLRKGLSFS